MNKKPTWLWILAILLVLALIMGYGLRHTPDPTKELVLFNKPAPLLPPGELLLPKSAALPKSAVTPEGKGLFTPQTWTLLHFWDVSCVVCAQEADQWVQFTNQMQQKHLPVVLISVNIEDSLDQIQHWKDKYHWSFPVISDSVGSFSLDYGVTGTPETFFINPQGVVKFRVAGEISQSFLNQALVWLQNHPEASFTEESQALDSL